MSFESPVRLDLEIGYNRRRFVQGLALIGGAAALGVASRARAHGPQPDVALSGNGFDLSSGEQPVDITGKARVATAINGSMPGPVLRFNEGDAVTIRSQIA